MTLYNRGVSGREIGCSCNYLRITCTKRHVDQNGTEASGWFDSQCTNNDTDEKSTEPREIMYGRNEGGRNVPVRGPRTCCLEEKPDPLYWGRGWRRDEARVVQVPVGPFFLDSALLLYWRPLSDISASCKVQIELELRLLREDSYVNHTVPGTAQSAAVDHR